jgi:hypothetical protein
LVSAYVTTAQVKKISVHKKSQVLKKGKKQTIHADCYYATETGVFVTHYFDPKEFIIKTNRKGEMKVYFPEENKVSIKQDFYFSSRNELLYYFVNNLTEDLGLKKEGFEMTDTRYDEHYLVTTWSAPNSIKKINKVEIVFENMLPIYSAYFDNNNEIIRKIYYSNYYRGASYMLPKRITEITYTSESDSTIKRTIFSDIRENEEVDPYYINFEIPEDATITQ